MNRTIKQATVHRYFYETHGQLRRKHPVRDAGQAASEI
jgi:hypothetical protein